MIGQRIALSAAVAATVGWFAAMPEASAQRPTEGGPFAFEPSDDVRFWDEPSGMIRVHYSADGPNVTLLADEDSDGVPDFPQNVALTMAEVLEFFQIQRAMLRPPGEEQLGLEPLGGSYALDVYLIDFGGSADGAFRRDACDLVLAQCAGHMIIENDFVGYSYPSLQVAIDVLTSHELFHGIQSAYTTNVPIWFSEGTAVWAERQWDSDSPDFLRFAAFYLGDTGRSIDRPPGGPVPTFAYSTGIFYDFMTLIHDVSLISELVDAIRVRALEIGEGDEEVDILGEMITLIGGEDILRANWLDFTAWNLATGERAGIIDSYPYADELPGITAEVEGSAIDDTNRFYPLAATYYRLDHDGGAIWFGIEEAAPDLHFTLYPVADGSADGPVGQPVATWTGADASSGPITAEGDSRFSAGGYWLIGTKPIRGTLSTRVRICLGTPEAAAACAEPREEFPSEEEEPGEDDGNDGGGCAVAPGDSSTGAAGGIWLLILVTVLRGMRSRDRGAS
ncbi:MAG: MXAN_6640 family putative metalloprotease [Myxococcota bacterium]